MVNSGWFNHNTHSKANHCLILHRVNDFPGLIMHLDGIPVGRFVNRVCGSGRVVGIIHLPRFGPGNRFACRLKILEFREVIIIENILPDRSGILLVNHGTILIHDPNLFGRGDQGYPDTVDQVVGRKRRFNGTHYLRTINHRVHIPDSLKSLPRMK